MGETKVNYIGPREVLARGKNGDFKLKGFNVVGLKTNGRFCLTINFSSKKTGTKWVPGSEKKPPIQFTGRPEILAELFRSVANELEIVTSGNWRIEETVIYREEVKDASSEDNKEEK